MFLVPGELTGVRVQDSAGKCSDNQHVSVFLRTRFPDRFGQDGHLKKFQSLVSKATERQNVKAAIQQTSVRAHFPRNSSEMEKFELKNQ